MNTLADDPKVQALAAEFLRVLMGETDDGPAE